MIGRRGGRLLETFATTETTDKEKRRTGRWVLIGLAGLGAFVAMGVPMLAIMYFMSQMSSHMGRMVDSVERMSGNVEAMRGIWIPWVAISTR